MCRKRLEVFQELVFCDVVTTLQRGFCPFGQGVRRGMRIAQRHQSPGRRFLRLAANRGGWRIGVLAYWRIGVLACGWQDRSQQGLSPEIFQGQGCRYLAVFSTCGSTKCLLKGVKTSVSTGIAGYVSLRYQHAVDWVSRQKYLDDDPRRWGMESNTRLLKYFLIDSCFFLKVG